MGVRKETKIRTSFIEFVVALGIFIIALIIVNYYLFVVASIGVYPANYSEKKINGNFEQLKESPKVTTDLLTPMSSFGVYSNDGSYLYGNFSEMDKKSILNKFNMGERSSGLGNYITSIKREEGTLLIKYPLTMQFKDKKTRSVLPNAEITIIILVLIELITIIVLSSNRFAKKINKGLSSLLVATEKIEEGDLDFNVSMSNIKELNMVLQGIDKMKASLKVALEEQWIVEQQKREQISALAHDVKTPITIVKGNVELLKETDMTEEQKSYCDYIEESSGRMEKYIQSLLFITRNEVQNKSRHESIYITEMLNSLKRQVEALCKTKNINMIWRMNIQKELYIKGYKDELESALMNIISNAVDYTPQDSSVKINNILDKSQLIIQIIDQGKGFSEKMLKHGKEQLAMEDESRTRNGNHGLGLYIADNIIKKYNGELTLNNDVDGGGGVVIVKIPIEQI